MGVETQHLLMPQKRLMKNKEKKLQEKKAKTFNQATNLRYMALND